ncbi:cysteine-rich CWC family protein [Paenibacillus sp. sgz302251]|uniref:cysteine-rich CWC family protein n=1 Tax=Paenibacillus sp. sgz302251 TaxID=3414493 RepID=UPI003C7A5877
MECPICGEPNHCGVKDVKEQGVECWCFHEHFPKGLLALVPEEKRGKACICKTCSTTYKEASKL